jgi:lysylphosphatidylglycerol synthetase-like protein (DUF2156 family)
MEDTNFVLLWKEHYEKIELSLAINQRLLKETISGKAESALQSLVRVKTRGIVIAILYLLLLGSVLFYALSHYSPAANYFIGSMAIIFLINVKALSDYIRHLVWVSTIDYNGSITTIQQKLTRLQLSIFKHTRIMFLQFPFWTTFYLGSHWFPHPVSWPHIIVQFLLTASFTWLAYWLYKNLVPANAGKKWVKMFLGGSGSNAVARAMDFYREIEAFKK